MDLFHHHFDAAREKRRELEADPAEVEKILLGGAERAREVATQKLDQVKKLTGLR